jgi:hypothetical protein
MEKGLFLVQQISPLTLPASPHWGRIAVCEIRGHAFQVSTGKAGGFGF